MNAYRDEDERAIRTGRLVQDWAKSRLLTEEQRATLAAELQVDLRRTNRFLRATLFVFGFMILQSVVGLLIISIEGSEIVGAIMCGMVAAGCFGIANLLVTQYKLYRFGIEEAAAVACVVLAAASAALFGQSLDDRSEDLTLIAAMVTGSATSFVVFRRFGYVYAAIGAMILAAAVPFVPGDSDALHRVLSAGLLVAAFAAARSARQRYGADFPADSYAIIEAAAWIGVYLIFNLQLSSWLSSPEDRSPFYWATYVITWLLPAVGLFIAVRDRHRMLLDVNIAMAILTLMTNKSYLGTPQQPYDPITFGLLLAGIAIGLRRWLASGANGSRDGFIAERLLASEKSRLGLIQTASVLHQPAPVASHPQPPQGPAIGGGGASGGAGGTGKY